MAGNITWSLTDSGPATVEPRDMGIISQPGLFAKVSTTQQHFVRHDGGNPITGVGFYLQEYSGTYNGSTSSAADFAELLALGDSGTPLGFGGIQFAYNNTEPLATFDMDQLSASNKGDIGSLAATDYAINIRTGHGDSLVKAIPLPSQGASGSGAGTAGEIQSGENDVNFYTRLLIPKDIGGIGVREVDIAITYTFTS